MNHSFDIDVAHEVGVEAAILFNSIQHWCARNEANREAQRDGYTWMYNSRSAWCELFPYLGEKQIRNALERLLDAKLIERAQFSAGSVNRTYWYRLAERAKEFGPKGQTVGRKGQTITSTDNTTEKDIPSVSPQPTKAPRRANPQRSIAVLLEDVTEIPDDLRQRAGGLTSINDEWAKFRNHHISVRSKHTRIDLAWDTWCRNAAKWQRGSSANGATGAGKGGGKRHDHVAAATDSVLAELFGVQREKGKRGGDERAASATVVSGGARPVEASCVDVSPGDKTSLIEAGGTGGSSQNCNA